MSRGLREVQSCKRCFQHTSAEDQGEQMGRQGVETCEKRRDTKNDEERMSNTYKENIKLITEYYSGSSRADLAIEEMAELQKALLKYRRADRNELMTLRMKDVIEEIADVKITLDQLIELYGCSDDVEEMIGYKIDRQLKRIERKEKKKWKLL